MARMRVCATTGCPAVYPREQGSYCPQHRAQVNAERSRHYRQHYGREHEATRARLLPAAYGTPCPRCGEPMLPGQELDLGHSTDRAVDPSAAGDRIEHASCNRAAGGRAGAAYRSP
jgi:hypothetical protein